MANQEFNHPDFPKINEDSVENTRISEEQRRIAKIITDFELKNIDTVTSNELVKYIEKYTLLQSCRHQQRGTKEGLMSHLCAIHQMPSQQSIKQRLENFLIAFRDDPDTTSALKKADFAGFKGTPSHLYYFQPVRSQIFRTQNQENSLSETKNALLSISSPHVTKDLNHRNFYNHLPDPEVCIQELDQLATDFFEIFGVLQKLSDNQELNRNEAQRLNDYCGEPLAIEETIRGEQLRENDIPPAGDRHEGNISR